MKKYTLKRIITSLFTLLAILLVLFILMQLMPGSPFNDEKLTPEMRASLYARYGLDQPIYVQFFRYVTNMLRGDFGVSYNISKNTPIRQSETLFFDTLYDENASCHLALGMGFPECLEGGVNLGKEELLARGVNQSVAHVDFMIGTDDLNVWGICEDGTEVPVFENGQWAWE